MRNYRILYLILFVLLMSIVCQCASEPKRPNPVNTEREYVTGLTVDQVLKLGLDKFVDLYISKSGDDSEKGVDTAYITYSRLRTDNNNVLILSLSTEDKLKVLSFSEKSSCFEDLYYTIATHNAGGGTIFNHLRVQTNAERIETIGKIIDNSNSTTRNIKVHKLADKYDKLVTSRMNTLVATSPATSKLKNKLIILYSQIKLLSSKFSDLPRYLIIKFVYDTVVDFKN